MASFSCYSPRMLGYLIQLAPPVSDMLNPLPFQQLQNERLTSWAFKRNKKMIFVALANTTNASQGRRSSGDKIIMVDPLEAKRLAEKQMSEIKIKEKFKRRRQAEAINGALAMIGLTAGLVLEGQTGKGILGQLGGYLASFVSLFMR